MMETIFAHPCSVYRGRESGEKANLKNKRHYLKREEQRLWAGRKTARRMYGLK
jgi:hypothetical protein